MSKILSNKQQELVDELMLFAKDSGNHVFCRDLARYLKSREENGKLKHSNIRY